MVVPEDDVREKKSNFPSNSHFTTSLGIHPGSPRLKTFHFLLHNPRIPEGFLKGSLKESLTGPCTCQPKDPSKPLQNAFKNPSKTFQEGVEIDDVLGFPGLKNQFQGPGVL